ncbi:SRPBCC family protein [Brachybacterium phenoliresistens]|uniref:Polyketide cyclase n=1 Tax=Brachybacterium phenoliresistens TaxID=396014 RepID=Z9JX09_9MICO|nr:SRPBCC family protein [Brachybacterium phenoliresistens]EWS82729.1 hypothetical protein BF93_06810 [Brachybacterium phenoliresistens]
MRFTVRLEIALPREKVLDLLTDPAQRPKWLRGLVRHEPVHGREGQVGTVSTVELRSGKGTMQCTETITRREPEDLGQARPEQVVRYEREILAPGMWSAARERLSVAGPERTLWESENEYRFTGAMRWFAPFLRRAFIAQTRSHMEDFRAFAEHGTDVRAQDR